LRKGVLGAEHAEEFSIVATMISENRTLFSNIPVFCIEILLKWAIFGGDRGGQ
jgi:hypothetical protein